MKSRKRNINFVRLWIFVLMFFLSKNTFAQEKNVLVLHSYYLGFQSFTNEYDGILSVFSKHNIKCEFDFMDSNRNNYDSLYSNYYKSLKLKYPDFSKFSAVLVCHDHALRFVSIYRDSIFKNMPIVFCGINNLSAAKIFEDDSLTTGIFENLNVTINLKKLLSLFPTCGRVNVVSDGTLTSNCDEIEFSLAEKNFPKILFNHLRLEDLSYQKLAEELAIISPSDLVVVISAMKDANGQNKNLGEAVQFVANYTDAPVFNFYDVTIESGNLGGYLVSHFKQGEIAAQTITEIILNNKKVSDFDFVFSGTSNWIYDYKKMQAHNIGKSDVERKSILINYYSVWNVRNFVFLLTIVLFLLLIIIFFIIYKKNKIKDKSFILAIETKNKEINSLKQKLDLQINNSLYVRQIFDIITETSKDSIVIIKCDTFEIVYADNEFINLTEFRSDEILHNKLSDFLQTNSSENDKDAEFYLSKKVNFTCSIICNEFKTKQIYVACGSKNLPQTKDFLCCTIHDLSEKIQQKKKISDITEKMIDNERKYFTIFDKMYEGAAIVDSNFNIVETNRALSEISGYSKQELTKLNLKDLVFNYLQLQIKIDKKGKRYDFQLQRNDTSLISASLVANKIILNNKEFYLCIVEDVSEQKMREQEIINAKNLAEQSNLLINEFIHNMTHEVRTPLNGIVGFSELLDEKFKDNAALKRYTGIILNCSHQLNKIIDEILEVSRLTVGKVKIFESQVCANALLSEIYNEYYQSAELKKLSFRVVKPLPDNKVTFVSDAKKINSVLSKLVENAIKFTVNGFIEIGYNVDNQTIIFYVKDSGIGIDEKYVDLVFKKFGQASKQIFENSGLGLGLPIAKETAKILNGDINFVSKIDEGSEFTFSLPFNAVNLPEKNLVSDNENSIAYKIIVAEDDEINFLYLDYFVKNSNFNVQILSAQNGKQAVDLFLKNKDVKLILMDIKMPIMDGIAATKIIRQHNTEVPIVALTAYSSVEDFDRIKAAGCNRVITKPIDNNKLTEVFEKIINK